MRNTYTEWSANNVLVLRFSIIAHKMRFNVWRMPVILAIIRPKIQTYSIVVEWYPYLTDAF